jgi:hypothetical protein
MTYIAISYREVLGLIPCLLPNMMFVYIALNLHSIKNT